MISSKEVEILNMILQDQTDDILDFNSLGDLEEKNFVSYTGAGIAYVTNAGLAELENFQRNEETLGIARKANRNSLLSVAISVFALIASVLIGVLC